MTLKKEEILDSIMTLPVIDLDWLVKELAERFGVSAAPPVAAASVGAAAGAPAAVAEAPAEEQTEFTVVLQEVGANKINVIKTVREIDSSLGLKEAKDLVEAAPKPVREAVSKEEADQVRGKLEAAGAKVSIQ